MKKVKVLNEKFLNSYKNKYLNSVIEHPISDYLKSCSCLVYNNSRATMTSFYISQNCSNESETISILNSVNESMMIEFIPFFNEIYLFAPYFGAYRSDPINVQIYKQLMKNKCNPILCYFKKGNNYIIKNSKLDLFYKGLIVTNDEDFESYLASFYIGIPLTDENITGKLKDEILAHSKSFFNNMCNHPYYYDKITKFNLKTIIDQNKDKEKFLSREIIKHLLMENAI